jgi:hypothetical protein
MAGIGHGVPMPVRTHDPSGFRPSLTRPRSVDLRWFIGTTPSSDFPAAYLETLWVGPCVPRSRRRFALEAAGISRFPRVKRLGMLWVCDTARVPDDIVIASSVMLPSPRHNEVSPQNEISVLTGWPAHAAVNASPTTLRAACAGSLSEPADASLAVIVVRYSFRWRGLAPLVSHRLLPAHHVH